MVSGPDGPDTAVDDQTPTPEENEMDTDRDYHVTSVQTDAQAISRKLRDLANRIDQLTAAFATTGRPVGLAADIVNDYTQGVGSVGTHLWSLIKDAQDFENAIRA